MKKKAIALIIFLVIVLAVGVGFWRWKNEKMIQIIRRTNLQQQQLAEEAKKQEEEKRVVQTESQDQIKLSEEEIQKLKNDKTLVWYEVPELGVKFQVTPYGKEALKYKQVYSWGDSIMSVDFFDSIDDWNNSICSYPKDASGEKNKLCGTFSLSRMTSQYNEKSRNDAAGFDYACGSNKITKSIGISGRGMVLQDKGDVVCLGGYYQEQYSKEYGIVLSSFSPLNK